MTSADKAASRPSQGDHQAVHEALDEALKGAQRHMLELGSARLIVFSDQHRGARNSADNFRESEEIYNAALEWYFEHGFTLVVLGDVEELWQEKPAAVLEAYAHSLSLEAKFHQEGRYFRVWGNHDDLWEDEDAVKKHLQPLYGEPPLEVVEGLGFSVAEGGRELGKLFLVHGSQGTAKSDRWAGVSRLAVRYLYRPFQRLTGMSLDTPSKNWRLREEYDKAMYSWTTRQERLVLIAGHTHRPVFESRSDSDQVRKQLEAIKGKLERDPDSKRLREQAKELTEELERLQDGQEDDSKGSERMVKPCYFNTGCCSFPGGDITGIEISEGEIRLVHWPDEEGRPRPQVLARDPLKKVFAECRH